MTVRAVGTLTQLYNWTQDSRITTGSYGGNIDYIGLDASTPVSNSNCFLPSVLPQSTKAQVEADIKAAIQADLVTNHGYIFNVGDSVILM